MCGIAGLVTTAGPTGALSSDAVQRMTDHMRARGPDAQGLWMGEGVVLGHRRLAILDLDVRANQPMLSADRRFAIVFNGEIYNFRELRRDLAEQGASFRTNSDTEVLLVLFEREGERMLRRLRGMFALAIWDAQEHALFLARDPYGIKPLYYARLKTGLLFASQVKALLASGAVSAQQEAAGLAGFCLWGSVPEPWTLFRDIFALPAGHWLRMRDDAAGTPVCWHDIRSHWRGEGRAIAADELQETVRQAATDSVRAHLVADVPVSVFLSGGVDSGVVAGLVSELDASVECVTIGFEEFRDRPEDEVPAARSIAARFGFPLHVRTVSREEFQQDIPRIFHAMDQPSINGVNTWFASKAAAERGYKVVLSGIGGDELFCGYSSFRQIPRHAVLGRVLASIPSAAVLLRRPFSVLARVLSQPKLVGVHEFSGTLEGLYFLRRGLFMPGELPELLGVEMAREGLARLAGSPAGITPAHGRDGVAAVGLLESTRYLRNQLLRDSDWASMAHSLELRTPLVDARLLETLGPFVSDFAAGAGKAMLAHSPRKSLPDSILTRPKTGFSLPMETWLSDLSNAHASPGRARAAATGMPWARQWARQVLAGIDECG